MPLTAQQFQRSATEYHQSAVIPNKGGQTVYEYWINLPYLKQLANGATVVSGPTRNASGDPDPMGHYNNARVYNTIIINNVSDVTLIHEFLHWQVSGDHVAIADSNHLDLARFGYQGLEDDDRAGNAINEFFFKGLQMSLGRLSN
jgi:hypothetical protein